MQIKVSINVTEGPQYNSRTVARAEVERHLAAFGVEGKGVDDLTPDQIRDTLGDVYCGHQVGTFYGRPYGRDVTPEPGTREKP